MMAIKYLLLFLITFRSFAFTVGSGSEFKMTSNGGQQTNLSIYFVGVKDTELDIEYYFTTNSIFMPHMWQQFKMQRTNGPIRIKKGFVKAGFNSDVEEMGKEHFEINKGQGVELSDFLINTKADIEKYFIGNEKVEVPAGSVMSRHYRQTKNGQTIDFWISDIVKPIGLVKLVSKNPKKSSHNYTIELSSLIKNVAAGIDPKKAKPMSKETRAMFQKTGR